MKKIIMNIQKFSSTNKTANLELSQYTANDKPTYLVDYNADMSKIDTGVHNVDVKATTNETNIGTMANLSTTEKTTLVGAINEVKASTVANATNIAGNTTDIGTLANLNTTIKSNLVNAINEVDENIKKFDLTNIETITSNDIINGTGTVTVASNSDGSIAKIYGNITAPGYPNSGNVTFNTSLRPDEEITIIGNCVVTPRTNDYAQNTDNGSITIKTNGNIEIPFGWFNGSTSEVKISLINSLLFIKNFGDTPINPQ